VTTELASLSSPIRTEDVALLVDAGATLSWIPREMLQRLGVAPVSRLPFTLADGRTLERDVASVLFTIDGRKAPVPVAFGEPGEEVVMGATALEILGLAVDPVAQKLVPRNLFALVGRFKCVDDLISAGWRMKENVIASPQEECQLPGKVKR
jgi:aspartyl protease family protein